MDSELDQAVVMLKLASCIPTLNGQKVVTMGRSCFGTDYGEPQLSARRDGRSIGSEFNLYRLRALWPA